MKLSLDYEHAVAALRILNLSLGVYMSASPPLQACAGTNDSLPCSPQGLARDVQFIFRHELGLHRGFLAETDPGPC